MNLSETGNPCGDWSLSQVQSLITTHHEVGCSIIKILDNIMLHMVGVGVCVYIYIYIYIYIHMWINNIYVKKVIILYKIIL